MNKVRPVRFLIIVSTTICLLAVASMLQAQVKKDSVEKKSFTKKAFREGMKLISTHPKDTIINEKSVDPYKEYAGRIIRHIEIERIGFEKSIYDSAKKVKKTTAKLANTLHVDTRHKVIRNHLFIRINEPLNPSELADNERFLRDKDFILDSRIIVTPVEGTDSVDLTVLTRDVFSLGATGGGSLNAPRVGVYDANIGGRGQRLQFDMLVDGSRSPNAGYAILYRKSSVLGSLTNLELRYSQLNSGLSIGDENEYVALVRVDRPLVSPYSRIAGGGEVSRNWSVNIEGKPDSVFLKYNYSVLDYWFGYNFGVKKEIENRNRKFLAIRHFDGVYTDQPDQELYNVTRKYNSIYGYLSELTFYRQNFYKTRYLLGFGRTEDVPYGFTLGFTGGYVKQLRLERPYAAIKFDYVASRKKGDIFRISAKAGGYLGNDEIEDIILQGGLGYVSRLLQFNQYKMRNYITTTYTHLANHRVIDLLKIDKKEIPGFKSDSLNADKRLAVHLETVLFTPRSILGFRFAPFAAVDAVAVNCVACVNNNNVYWGYTAGFRTRNENLIFGTIEVKFSYLPEDQYGNSKFVFGYKQNLQVKNTGSFVKAPSLITYN